MAQYIAPMTGVYGAGAPGFTYWIAKAGDTIVSGSNADGKFICLTKGGAVGTFVAGWDVLDGINDLELLVKFKLSSDSGKQGILAARYSGNSEASTKGYTLSNSFLHNTGTLAIDEGSTGYAGWVNQDYQPNVMYWARYKIQGTKFWAKKWVDGQPEPRWQLEVDNSVTSAGSYNGITTYNKGSVWFHHISAGTDGDPAPYSLSHDSSITGRFKIHRRPEHTPIDGYTANFYGAGYGTPIYSLASARSKDTSGKFRIRVVKDASTAGKFRVRIHPSKTIAGRVSVVVPKPVIQHGQFSVANKTTHSIVGNFAIDNFTSRHQIGVFTVQNQWLPHLSGVFRIYNNKTLPEAYIEEGQYHESQTNEGTIIGNVDYTLLEFDDEFLWLSEDDDEIIAEYKDNDIIDITLEEGEYLAFSFE